MERDHLLSSQTPRALSFRSLTPPKPASYVLSAASYHGGFLHGEVFPMCQRGEGLRGRPFPPIETAWLGLLVLT